MHVGIRVPAVVRFLGLLLLSCFSTSTGRRVLTILKDELTRDAHGSDWWSRHAQSERRPRPRLKKALASLLFAGQPGAYGSHRRMPFASIRVGRPMGQTLVRPVVRVPVRAAVSGTSGPQEIGPAQWSNDRNQVYNGPVYNPSVYNRAGKGIIELFNASTDVQTVVDDLRADIPKLDGQKWDGFARGIIKQNNATQRKGMIESLDDSMADFQKVVASVQADIPNLLHKLPDWGNFASDFKTIDHFGNTLEGVVQNTLLLKLLREIQEKFMVKKDVQVRLMLASEIADKATGTFLSARWKVQLGGAELPFLRLWGEESLVDIEVDTTFHFNEQRKVDYMRVNSWLVNGRKCQAWPEIDLEAKSATNLEKIKEWVEDLLPDLRPWWTENAGYFSHVEEVGSGNFAKVFSMDLLQPPNLQPTRIAMKELLPEMMDSALIKGEIAAMRELSEFLLMDGARRKEIMGTAEDYSPYCAPILAKPRVQEGRMYLPMPFANKGTFKDIYENPKMRALYGGDAGMYGMLLHIAKGVKALNGAGYVHNDLHGENALVTCTSDEIDPSNCYASVVDLGLATRTDVLSSGVRGKGKIISPEMVRLRMEPHYPIFKSDVWSLGILLWEIALGSDTVPTLNASGGKSVETIASIILGLDFKNESFPLLNEQPEVQKLLRGMLTQDISERWDIDKVITHLQKIAHPGMTGSHPSPFRSAGVIPGGLASCKNDPKIAPHVHVQIIGMQRATYLNGYEAEVMKYDDKIKGYSIRLADGTAVTVRSKNVRLVHGMETWCAV